MNALDGILQSQVPAVMVPRYEPLEPIRPDSHRYLVASDGLYLQVDRPWIHGIFKISDTAFPLPYGQVAPCINLRFRTAQIKSVLATFVAASRNACPIEHAAWVTFHPAAGGELGYFAPEILSQDENTISYVRPDATPDCLPFLDCHSHGRSPAYFSATDNRDDLSDDLKLAFVAGRLDQDEVSVAARIVGLGLNTDISEWIGSLVENTTTEAILNTP